MEFNQRPPKGMWAPGNYMGKCDVCDMHYAGDKRSRTCCACAYQEVDRIAELGAKVADHQATIKQQSSKLAGLEATLARVKEAICETEEINPSNYDHDLVIALNNAMIESYSIISDIPTPIAVGNVSGATINEHGYLQLWTNIREMVDGGTVIVMAKPGDKQQNKEDK